jgi:hypothetical protein
MSEQERMLLQHLVNMLAIIAADREVLKIQRGSTPDKEIVAARKAVIEMRSKHGEYDDAERAI